MNKLKKSAVVIPALAMIAVTAAASVSGTVAWFTANRAVSVTAGNFVSSKLDSSLTVESTGGVGTSVDNDKKIISVDSKDTLTHGSYDAKAITGNTEGHLYVANLADGADSVSNYTDYGPESAAKQSSATGSTNKWCASTNSATNAKTWYGVSWKMSFTLTENAANRDNYLLFDVKGSSFTDSNKDNANKETTLKGFRIAFMTSAKFLVVGGDDTDSHTTGTNASDTANFGANYVNVNSAKEKFLDNAETIKTDQLSLGKFSSDSGNKIDITCVAWYEGSDDNVKDSIGGQEISMSSTNVTLSFYTRYISA